MQRWTFFFLNTTNNAHLYKQGIQTFLSPETFCVPIISGSKAEVWFWTMLFVLLPVNRIDKRYFGYGIV